jgi:heparan-alpha-glucosaminide N-acetyltransferase
MSSIIESPPVEAPRRSPNEGPQKQTPNSASGAVSRLQSLDAYRGLIMISLAFGGFGLRATAEAHLGIDPGSSLWRGIYDQFEHRDWIGCSYWDLIQPSFMFMVGVSMAYSYLRRQREGQSWGRMFGHACWRGLVLILLGVFLTSNNSRATNWQFMNVLSQIGLGYPFLFLLWGRSVRTHAIAAAALLLGTWALYALYPAPGIDPAKGAPNVGVSAKWAQQHLTGVTPAWHKNANVGQAIDVPFLNAFPRKDPFVFNPGGYQTINFIPSLATMLFGLMVGELLRSSRDARKKFYILIALGLAGLALGLILSGLGVPLVKRIWTPSWAVFSTGWCLLILGTLYAIVDLHGYRKWTFPLVVVGMNSIAIYMMSHTLKPWTTKTLQTHLGENVFKMFGPANAPFVQYTMLGLVFWLVCYWMYRRKIFLRI